jgi:hypothetical protein
MDLGLPIKRYQVTAGFRDGVVEWSLHLETDDGERHQLIVRDGEEVPLLLEICRHDRSIYFDSERRVLRTGWNFPGAKLDH